MPTPYHRLNVYLTPADYAIMERARADLGVRHDTEILRVALRALARERGYSFVESDITDAQAQAISRKLAEALP